MYFKNTGTDLFGLFTLSQKHSHVEDRLKVEKSELGSFGHLIYDMTKL